MRVTTRPRTAVRTALAAAAIATVGVICQAFVASPAHAAGATTVTKLELKGTQLRIEGRTAGAGFVAVESTTSIAGGYAEQGFAFKIQADGFTAPTCAVTVRGINAPDLSVGIPNCTPSAA
ncbi:MAG: hypothetical protein QOK35_732 [Pseudonocardiales bacterium]|nr:hypothetical protein [Pseudonocardiales bacterium]